MERPRADHDDSGLMAKEVEQPITAAEEEKDGTAAVAASSLPGKPRVVRIKRKRALDPIENLWLEVSEPPIKRQAPDIAALTLSSTSEASLPTNTDTPSKLLFWRVETVSPSRKAGPSLYETLLLKVNERKQEKRKDRRESLSKSKGKQDHLLASSKEQHEAVAKRARFEQVWKSRRVSDKTASHDGDDAIHELFHIYDVIRIDEEADAAERDQQRQIAKREAALAEGALMCNYLPLLRECLPEVAADVEEDLASLVQAPTEAEDYVYDVYAMDEGFSEQEGSEDQFFPTVQIVEDEDYDCQEADDSDFDSQDSNDENNPLNDYPDEDDFGGAIDKDSDDTDDSGDFDPYGSDNEEYDLVADDDEHNLRWGRRL